MPKRGRIPFLLTVDKNTPSTNEEIEPKTEIKILEEQLSELRQEFLDTTDLEKKKSLVDSLNNTVKKIQELMYDSQTEELAEPKTEIELQEQLSELRQKFLNSNDIEEKKILVDYLNYIVKKIQELQFAN